MKVKMLREPEDIDGYRHQARLLIEDDEGKKIADQTMGNLSECPEDANLVRDFCWFYSLPDWLKAAHAAGAAGEALELFDEEVESVW